MVTAIPLCLYVESRQCFCSVVNRKSVQAGWIMVMSQRPGAWWEWRWMCGGWSGWKWGRLWKYDGLEFRLSLAAQRLSESYLKQIDFPWSLPLSSCLSASENLKPATKKNSISIQEHSLSSPPLVCMSQSLWLTSSVKVTVRRQAELSHWTSIIRIKNKKNPNITPEFTLCPPPPCLINIHELWAWAKVSAGAHPSPKSIMNVNECTKEAL